MRSVKGCFATATIVVVVVGGSILFLGQELTRAKREAAVTHIRELADSYSKAPGDTQQAPGESGDVPVLDQVDNADAHALFLRLVEMEKALAKACPKGFHACHLECGRGYYLAPTDDELGDLESIVAQAGDLISEIRRLATMGGPYFVPVLDDASSKAKTEPNDLHNLMALLTADALTKSRKSSPSESVADLLAIARLIRETPRGPRLILDYFRRQQYILAFQAAQEFITASAVSADELTQLEAQIPSDPERELFKQGLITSGALGVSRFDSIREKGVPGGSADSDGIYGYMAKAAIGFYFGPVVAPLSNQDLRCLAETTERFAAPAALPYYEARPQLEALDREFERTPPWWMVSHALIYRPSFKVADQACYEVCLDTCRMGLFLQAYRQQHGTYPPTLDAIAGRMNGRLPVDPYSGQNYVYMPSDDSFYLYSAGYNGKDDGGANDIKYDDHGNRTGSADDFGWRGKS